MNLGTKVDSTLVEETLFIGLCLGCLPAALCEPALLGILVLCIIYRHGFQGLCSMPVCLPRRDFPPTDSGLWTWPFLLSLEALVSSIALPGPLYPKALLWCLLAEFGQYLT